MIKAEARAYGIRDAWTGKEHWFGTAAAREANLKVRTKRRANKLFELVLSSRSAANRSAKETLDRIEGTIVLDREGREQ